MRDAMTDVLGFMAVAAFAVIAWLIVTGAHL